MQTWENVAEIAAPPERVWALTVDVERLPQITPTITAAEQLDPGELQVGHRVRLKQPGSGPRIWNITTLNPPTQLAWQTALGPLTMRATHLVEPSGTGTRNTLRVELIGPAASLLSKIVSRQITQAIATENAGFKRVAEDG